MTSSYVHNKYDALLKCWPDYEGSCSLVVITRLCTTCCRASWAENLTCRSFQTAWNYNKCINLSTSAQTMFLGWKRECVQEIQPFGSLQTTKAKFTKLSLKFTVSSWALALAPLCSAWDKWPSNCISMVQKPPQVVKETGFFPSLNDISEKVVILQHQWKDWQPLHSNKYLQHLFRAPTNYKLRLISRLINVGLRI